ncbi:MAG: polysaccharide deacetylase family protein [Spirosomataceae bacterium]
MAKVLQKMKVKAWFFFTGDFYRNPSYAPFIRRIKKDGHYLSIHSDKHLLYCDWTKRDSLLVSKDEFLTDLKVNFEVAAAFGVQKSESRLFMPPYEWYNQTIVNWCREIGLEVVNLTPRTATNADYTTPSMKNYRSSETILNQLFAFEQKDSQHLNGAILLIHLGTDPERTDKLYLRLEELIQHLWKLGYRLGD